MTKEQLQAFLTDAGVAFSSPEGRRSNAIDFKNRGTILEAIAYDQGDLLHITCTCGMPAPAPTPAKVQEVFQAIEDQFPIVKLLATGSKDAPSFMVSAEQFEPDVERIGGVFWRTADLLVTAARETYLRLSPQQVVAASEKQPDPLVQWIAKLEEALRQGCNRPGSKTGDGDNAAVYARVKSSLALVITKDGSTGSAFCVASDATASYYVTNAHVTRGSATVTLYRQKPDYEKMEATVAAEGDGKDVDLALLRVSAANVPPLKLKEQPPKDESPIALAGYARVQLWAAEQFGELIPSIHLGTITGLLKNGSCVMHDVVCRPGDSGGPLFDPESGEVVGVQEGGWQEEEEAYAIGAPVLASFLKAGKVLA
jgi:S1-C subfamily serine protease